MEVRFTECLMAVRWYHPPFVFFDQPFFANLTNFVNINKKRFTIDIIAWKDTKKNLKNVPKKTLQANFTIIISCSLFFFHLCPNQENLQKKHHTSLTKKKSLPHNFYFGNLIFFFRRVPKLNTWLNKYRFQRFILFWEQKKVITVENSPFLKIKSSKVQNFSFFFLHFFRGLWAHICRIFRVIQARVVKLRIPENWFFFNFLKISKLKSKIEIDKISWKSQKNYICYINYINYI